MRITIKPPSPTPPSLVPGALLTVRVEAADPRPLLAGPPSVAYEGRYTTTPAPAFLFPAPAGGEGGRGVSTAAPAASAFRLPVVSPRNQYVDVDAAPGDTITATLLAGGKAYTASLTAPAPGSNPGSVELQLVEGGATPPGPPPTPQPSPGLTITPDDPDDPDVLTLDPAPGNDNIVVVN